MKHDGINIENALKIDYLTINIKNTNPLDLINLLCANSINDNVSPEDFIYYDSGCMRSYGQSYRYLDKRFISINFNEVGSLANNGVTLNITGQGTEFFDFQCFSNFYKALIENEMIFKVTRMDLAFDDFHGVIPKHYFIEEAEKFMNGDSNISTKKTSNSVKIYTESYNGKSHKNLVFGQRSSSEQLFRLYNKLAEQKIPADSPLKYWERLELELRGSKSTVVAYQLFVNKFEFKEIFYQLLISFFRPIVPGTGVEINKCKTQPWFEKFTSNFLQLSFKIIFREELKKKVDLLSNKLVHLCRSYGKTIAMIDEVFPFALRDIVSRYTNIIKNDKRCMRYITYPHGVFNSDSGEIVGYSY